MLGYRVPDPDEAMLISGSKGTEGAPFKVVIGHGKFVIPFFRRVAFLGLNLKEAVVAEKCTTKQGLATNVKAVIAFKVAPDTESIIAAGQRFLDDQRRDRSGQDRMTELTGQIFAGHLRSIVGGMTLEDIITQRQVLAEQVLDASKGEMARIGLVVDSFQLTSVDDNNSGYIEAMSAPHNAAIQQASAIAQSKANQAAAEAEQESQRRQAEFARDTKLAKIAYDQETALKEADVQSEVTARQQRAAQAGPLAAAEAQQAVLEKQRDLATRNAELRQAQLLSEVIRPAEAEAQRATIAAKAEAEITRVNAEAEANQRTLLADADAHRASQLAAAAASNNRVSLDQKLIEVLPEIARSLGNSLGGANVTVLNGGEGLTQLTSGFLTQALAVWNTLKTDVAKNANQLGDVDVEPVDVDKALKQLQNNHQ